MGSAITLQLGVLAFPADGTPGLHTPGYRIHRRHMPSRVFSVLCLPGAPLMSITARDQTLRNTKEPLVPPKPKLLLTDTSIFILRAVLAQ